MITRRLARPLSALSPSGWICPSCTQQSRATTPLRQPRLPAIQQRGAHKVPILDYDTTFKNEGVPNLWTSTGFQLAWTDYMELLTRKLNELTAGDAAENMKPKDITLQYARDPMNASLFNHASMAHNNYFFIRCLSTAPKRLDKCPALKSSLESSFGTIDTLRTTMLDTAAAMFGPGFVWLVWARNPNRTSSSRGEWRILTTYIAGTPYPEAGYRQQGLDMNASNATAYDDYRNAKPANTVGYFGAHSQPGASDAAIPPGGTSLMPVLCVNTWEHAYIFDFGLHGKRKYLADWWDVVDWGQVELNAPDDVVPKDAGWGMDDS